MPYHLHKLSVHGANKIEPFVMPIGHSSEEAQEGLHKVVRIG